MASAPPPPPVWSPPVGAPQTSTAVSAVLAQPGGFWKRSLALTIDSLVLTVPIAAAAGLLLLIVDVDFSSLDPGESEAAIVIALVLLPLAFIGVVLVSWLYEALMTSSARGATLGKQAMGLRIVRADGARLSFGRATARFFARSLITPLVPLGIGYLMAAFTAGKRALHDFMADTLVIRSR